MLRMVFAIRQITNFLPRSLIRRLMTSIKEMRHLIWKRNLITIDTSHSHVKPACHPQERQTMCYANITTEVNMMHLDY
jgi:hypothetical protein